MMKTRRQRARPGARFALLGGALLASLLGCETVEVEPPPPEPEVREEQPAPAPVAVPVVEANGSLVVRLHPDSIAAMPEGAITTVTLAGERASRSTELPMGERLVRFDELETGRYDLIATVNSGGFEIGSYAYFVNATQAISDVTIRLDYVRTALEVQANVQTRLDRRYVGTAAVAANACPDGYAEGSVLSDLHIASDGETLTLTIEKFQQETLRLSGRLSHGGSGGNEGTESPAVAAGTFESSGGASGNWRLSQLTAPAPTAIAALIEFDDQTQSCQSTFDYSGLEEDGTALTATGSGEPLAAVEVVGHGQTRVATLREGESVVRFDGLLLGAYDIFVGVHRAEKMIDSRRESVVLTEAGGRVETTFETEWVLPPASRLAAAADRAPLLHTFTGKSVTAQGPPECTGSIPLVDTTTLTVADRDASLAMTFDSFYGNVLELDGTVGDTQPGPFTASGTYRSSDNKTGSWSLNHLATPTPRSVAMLVAFHNETDSCQATLEFAGVR